LFASTDNVFVSGGLVHNRERLERLGLAKALPEAGLSDELLTLAVSEILAKPKPSLHPLDLKGSERTSFIVRNAL